VLQGFKNQTEFNEAKYLLSNLQQVELGGFDICLEAALNYRILRKKGVTIRKTIDMIIATFCIKNGHKLLHNDRDFDQLKKYLGLQVV
jgi:predicted nucleic acid-binding protein